MLDHSINISNICCIVMKKSSLQQRVSKFTPNKFYEINPSTMTIIITTSSVVPNVFYA